MGVLMFLLLVGVVVMWGYGLVTSRTERAQFVRELRDSPLKMILTLIDVAGCLAFGFGIIFPPFGMIKPFGLQWPLWAIGGVTALAFFVIDLTLLDRR